MTEFNILKQAYIHWQENPTLNSLQTTGLPISDIDFPAITICGQGSIFEVDFFEQLTTKYIDAAPLSSHRSLKTSSTGSSGNMSSLSARIRMH